VYEVNPDFISYRGYINVALYVIRVYTVGHVLPVSTYVCISITMYVDDLYIRYQ